jgi:hypothetical protein
VVLSQVYQNPVVGTNPHMRKSICHAQSEGAAVWGSFLGHQVFSFDGVAEYIPEPTILVMRMMSLLPDAE